MRSIPVFVLCTLLLLSCRKSPQTHLPPPDVISMAWTETAPNFNTTELLIPQELWGRIIFQKGDEVITHSGKKYGAKGKHDFLAYLPIDGSSEHGWLWCNHEEQVFYPGLGPGGGGTFLEVIKKDGQWNTLQRLNADFSTVNGTARNCLGAVSPWGTILTAEEFEPVNNFHLMQFGFPDTSDYEGRPAYQNIGWMVEVDPKTRKAKHKLYSMGRFMHEAAYCMPDQKTVYLMDDATPGAFFKFVADQAGDYREGQLFAYKQSLDGLSGTWIPLPRDREALINSRKEAFARGATIFIRMEDIELRSDGRFLITETGLDSSNFAWAMSLGAQPANHLQSKWAHGTTYKDLHGRILLYDPESEKMEVFLEGGPALSDPNKILSNPDNISIHPSGKWMFIHEDINLSRLTGLVPEGHLPSGNVSLNNEIYLLDLSIAQPKVGDLKRFATGPTGCETTGPEWTPDGRSYFFNLQHPSPFNDPPYHLAGTVVVTGF